MHMHNFVTLCVNSKAETNVHHPWKEREPTTSGWSAWSPRPVSAAPTWGFLYPPDGLVQPPAHSPPSQTRCDNKRDGSTRSEARLPLAATVTARTKRFVVNASQATAWRPIARRSSEWNGTAFQVPRLQESPQKRSIKTSSCSIFVARKCSFLTKVCEAKA